MTTRSGIVTLTTDFGSSDPYAAALEAALIKGWPAVRVVHVSHGVPPGDLTSGAYIAEYASRSFPAGTVHLAVVDPGVGTDRPMLVIETETFVLVGPGNGILDRSLRGQVVSQAATLAARPDVESQTFQSRDVMAPAAALAAAGAPIASLGNAAQVVAPPPALTFDWATPASFEVVYIDRFGTLVLDALHPGLRAAGEYSVEVAGRRANAGRTFADVAPGQLVIYRGSIGYVEVAVRDGSAAALLGLKAGDRVSVGP